MEMYKKSMREALKETRAYRDPKDVIEIVGGRGDMTIVHDEKGTMIIKSKDWQVYKAKGWQKKESVEEGYPMSYDEWLKKAKGITKGAHGITGDEHTRYSAEWRASVGKHYDNLPPIDKAKYLKNDFLKKVEDYVGKDVSQKLSYDKWLKQVKGIEKGAYGITGDEHTKYSKEWQAYKKEEVELDEAVDVSSYAKQVAGRTARNDHFGSRVILARMMKDKQLENFYNTLEKMHTTSQVSNAIGNDAITLRGKLEKVLKFRLKSRFGDKDTNTLMGAL